MDKNRINIKQIKERYEALYNEKSKYFSIWDQIAKYCRIEKKNIENTSPETSGEMLDNELKDPSTLLAISSAANNLYGIIIGDGNFFNLNISDELKEELGDDTSEAIEYIKQVSKILLREINKPQANFKSCFLEHLKDQQTFGTSGIGTFISNDYISGRSNNVFEFIGFGVDNITIDEGRNGLVDTIFVDYNWRVNKIVKTFCTEQGVFNQELFDDFPDVIKTSFKQKPNEKFNIQLAILQNDFFKQGVEGKIGCKYIGVWYFKDINNYVIKVEHYKDLPINITRVDKARGELYGRANGTKLLSYIKMLNYCMADAVETIDKMVHPAMGVIDGSLTGDKVIDTSPGSATVLKLPTGFNSSPIFPLQDVQDPSGLLNILIPYLRENVNTAFNTDILLDNNNQTVAKTATEMAQRYAIRSKLLFPIVYKQVNDILIPVINYCIKLLMQLGLIGQTTLSVADIENSKAIKIPDIILEFIREGKDWYKIEFNTEVAKMSKVQELQNITEFMQYIGGIASYNPNVLMSVDWYKMIERVEYLLNNGQNYLISESEYNDIMEQIQAQQMQAQQMQNNLADSEMAKNYSTSAKQNQEAYNGYIE